MDEPTNTTPPGDGKPEDNQSHDGNHAFANYATGSAFRIDLSKRMVAALLSAARGSSVNTGHFGVTGLAIRGLMEPTDGQEKAFYKEMRLTEAGEKVVDLCVMAGLGVGK